MKKHVPSTFVAVFAVYFVKWQNGPPTLAVF